MQWRHALLIAAILACSLLVAASDPTKRALGQKVKYLKEFEAANNDAPKRKLSLKNPVKLQEVTEAARRFSDQSKDTLEVLSRSTPEGRHALAKAKQNKPISLAQFVSSEKKSVAKSSQLISATLREHREAHEQFVPSIMARVRSGASVVSGRQYEQIYMRAQATMKTLYRMSKSFSGQSAKDGSIDGDEPTGGDEPRNNVTDSSDSSDGSSGDGDSNPVGSKCLNATLDLLTSLKCVTSSGIIGGSTPSTSKLRSYCNGACRSAFRSAVIATKNACGDLGSTPFQGAGDDDFDLSSVEIFASLPCVTGESGRYCWLDFLNLSKLFGGSSGPTDITDKQVNSVCSGCALKILQQLPIDEEDGDSAASVGLMMEFMCVKDEEGFCFRRLVESGIFNSGSGSGSDGSDSADSASGGDSDDDFEIGAICRDKCLSRFFVAMSDSGLVSEEDQANFDRVLAIPCNTNAQGDLCVDVFQGVDGDAISKNCDNVFDDNAPIREGTVCSAACSSSVMEAVLEMGCCYSLLETLWGEQYSEYNNFVFDTCEVPEEFASEPCKDTFIVTVSFTVENFNSTYAYDNQNSFEAALAKDAGRLFGSIEYELESVDYEGDDLVVEYTISLSESEGQKLKVRLDDACSTGISLSNIGQLPGGVIDSTLGVVGACSDDDVSTDFGSDVNDFSVNITKSCIGAAIGARDALDQCLPAFDTIFDDDVTNAKRDIVINGYCNSCEDILPRVIGNLIGTKDEVGACSFDELVALQEGGDEDQDSILFNLERLRGMAAVPCVSFNNTKCLSKFYNFIDAVEEVDDINDLSKSDLDDVCHPCVEKIFSSMVAYFDPEDVLEFNEFQPMCTTGASGQRCLVEFVGLQRSMSELEVCDGYFGDDEEFGSDSGSSGVGDEDEDPLIDVEGSDDFGSGGFGAGGVIECNATMEAEFLDDLEGVFTQICNNTCFRKFVQSRAGFLQTMYKELDAECKAADNNGEGDPDACYRRDDIKDELDSILEEARFSCRRNAAGELCTISVAKNVESLIITECADVNTITNATTCSAACAAQLATAQTALGCCFQVWLEDFLSPRRSRELSYWMENSCSINIPTECSGKIIKRSLRVGNVKYDYYLQNKQTLDTSLKSDVANVAGVSLKQIVKFVVSRFTSSAADAGHMATMATSGIKIDYEIETEDEKEAEEVESTLVAKEKDNDVQLSSLNSLPPDALEDPSSGATVDNSEEETSPASTAQLMSTGALVLMSLAVAFLSNHN